MSYVICNGYYVLNVNGKNYVVDKASDCSFVLQRKGRIILNGKTFSPCFAYGKQYYDKMVGKSVDGFICRDILDAVGGIEMDKGTVYIGQQPLAA